MSKLIITGIENGKISYVEGEEVVTSIEAIENEVKNLRDTIALAKAVNTESMEKDHLEALDKIKGNLSSAIKEAELAAEKAISEENERYESAKSQIISADKLELLEREEAKLSLVLGGLKAQVIEEPVEETPCEHSQVEGICEDCGEAEEIETPVEEVVEAEEVQAEVKPVPQTVEPEQLRPISPQVSSNGNRRVIF